MPTNTSKTKAQRAKQKKRHFSILLWSWLLGALTLVDWNTWFAFNSSVGVEIFPFHRFWIVVVVTNIAHQFFGQVLDRSEDTASNHIALNLGKPQFHLVEPRGVVGVKWMWTCGWLAKNCLTDSVLWAARLSAIRWISLRLGWLAISSAKKSTNSALYDDLQSYRESRRCEY